ATSAAAATAMQSTSNGSVAAAAVDERTRLLSEEEITTSTTVTSSPPPPLSSNPAIAVSVAPPTTLPLVHTTATTTTNILPSQQQQQQQNNNNNTNNNNAVRNVVNKTNKNQNQHNNNNATGETETEINSTVIATTTTADEEDLSSDLSDKFPRPQKKPGKLSKLGTKQVGLKRVSFGSSKGSMVETLVFETPTPLSEHVESTFGFDVAADAFAAAAAGQPQSVAATHPHPSHLPLSGSYSGDYTKANMDDSGIEVQEEAERSIVRVSIYQSNQPQQICPPAEYLLDSIDGGLAYNYSLDYETAVAAMQQQQHQLGLGAAYDRQQSTDSGWDNPFRPGGDLSREADEIVNMIRGGKPITPTEDRTIGNGSAHADDNCNGGTVIGESVTKTNLSQNQATAQNGTNSHAGKLEAGDKSATSADQSNGGGGGANNGVTNLGQVSKQVVPGPTSASHVVIDEKKNKKKGCCVIQ
ncbi:hypothetical protein KR026_010837, partial [Drosophila bipectinata]